MIPTEALEAIIAGTAECTSGPWLVTDSDSAGSSYLLAPAENASWLGQEAWPIAEFDDGDAMESFTREEIAANKAHIARLSPEVVRAMATRLLELERAIAEIGRRARGPEDGSRTLLDIMRDIGWIDDETRRITPGDQQ